MGFCQCVGEPIDPPLSRRQLGSKRLAECTLETIELGNAEGVHAFDLETDIAQGGQSQLGGDARTRLATQSQAAWDQAHVEPGLHLKGRDMGLVAHLDGSAVSPGQCGCRQGKAEPGVLAGGGINRLGEEWTGSRASLRQVQLDSERYRTGCRQLNRSRQPVRPTPKVDCLNRSGLTSQQWPATS